MQIILSDHNCEGQASALFEQLKRDGDWLQLVPMQLEIFNNIGLRDIEKYRGTMRLFIS